jgi:sec-independent protein translocase protein TatC
VLEHQDSPAEDAVMTVVEHLTELRRRIFISLFFIAIGAVVGYIVTPEVIRNLKDLGGITRPLIFTSPGGALFLTLKLSLMIGVVLASPVVLYHLWSFVSPGLTRHERAAIRPWVPLSLLFLVLGIGVAYVTLPLATTFLLGFAIPGLIEPLITTDAYFGFVTTMFLAFGLVMQFPFVILLLSKVGVVTEDQLRRNRRYVFVAIAIFAVIITPGGDPFSPTIMTLVMYPLYELTIRLVSRSSAAATARASADAAAD